MRRLVLSLILAFAASNIAHAAEPTTDLDAATAPAEQMNEATPTMVAPDGAQDAQPPTNRVGEAVPPMEAAEPHDTTPAPQTAGAPEPAVDDTTARFTVTDEEADKWLGRAVYSSDGNELGEVVSLQRDPDGFLKQVKADIGGFLGFGETRILIGPDQIKDVTEDRMVLTLTEAEAQELPAIDADE
jgi:PRC-barrel domain protein